MTTSVSRAGCSYFGVRIPRHVRAGHGRSRGARLHGRPAHVLRERLRLLPRHDGRDRRDLARRRASPSRRARGGSAARSAARPRAAGSRSIPRSARCSTTGAGSRPPASTAPPTATSARSGPTGCSSAGSTRSSGTSPRGSCRCTSASTTPRAGRAAATTAPSASAARSRRSGRRRCRRSARPRSSDFLREMLAHVAERGGANAICLLPSTEGTQGLADWDEVASLAGLDTLVTDPYWKHWDGSAEAFVRRFARLLRETADRHGVAAQLWVPSFGLTRDDIPDLEAAIAAAREEGVDDLWTWGYEACRHMTSLATPDSPLVWEAVSAALTGRPQTATTEAARADLADLDLRSTRDLVRLLNEEDATVPAAVAEAGDSLAAAIDAIVERMRRGGRLVYAGAGTSGALAALDAAECGSTFGSPPGEVLAVVAEQDADEDDRAAATNALLGLPLRPEDCVVAVSASGSTPFVLAALEAARECGALGVAVASARVEQGGRARRARGGGRGRARGDRRLDAAEGRHRAEARPQHDLDRDDDPARPHVRRPDGRRGARQREAPRAGAPQRRARERRVGGAGGRGARRPRPAMRGSRSSRCWPASTRTTPGRGSRPPKARCGRRPGNEARASRPRSCAAS